MKKFQIFTILIALLLSPLFNLQSTYAASADTDNDRVPDTFTSASYGFEVMYDWCFEQGVFQTAGCPADGDQDYVLTKYDVCPTIGGLGSNGCPEIIAEDLDGDDHINELDLCPTIFGMTESGCPIDKYRDTDNDGIADYFYFTHEDYFPGDECKDVAGLTEFGGCPIDTDLDGIWDIDDGCDNEMGPVSQNGCGPIITGAEDSDGDGYLNIEDDCQLDFFTKDYGCPYSDDIFEDTDEDSTMDFFDYCPSEPGEILNSGCPMDYDQDNVEDIFDKCPLIAGRIDKFGCADTSSVPKVDGVTVYRFFNKKTGAHLYTISLEEKNSIETTLASTWVYEGEKFKVYDKEITNTKPVYRFFNTKTGAHLYTIDETEKTTIIDTLPQFNYEGVKFYVFDIKYYSSYLSAYRFFNMQNGAHLYTVSEEEKNTIMNTLPKFAYEGVKFYVESL